MPENDEDEEGPKHPVAPGDDDLGVVNTLQAVSKLEEFTPSI